MKTRLILILTMLTANAMAALTVTNVNPVAVSTTSAQALGNLLATDGSTNAITAQAFYGLADEGSSSNFWSGTGSVTAVSGVGAFSNSINGLQPTTLYYYRWQVSQDTNTAWGSPAAWFFTTATGPTGVPPTTTYSVMVNTSGVIQAPGNFLSANNIATNGPSAATQSNLTIEVNRSTGAESNLNAAIVSEAATARGAEGTNAAAVVTEYQGRTNATAQVTALVTGETGRAASAETVLRTTTSNETLRAIGAENTLTGQATTNANAIAGQGSNIAANATAIGVNAAGLSNEIVRAILSEGSNAQTIVSAIGPTTNGMWFDLSPWGGPLAVWMIPDTLFTHPAWREPGVLSDVSGTGFYYAHVYDNSIDFVVYAINGDVNGNPFAPVYGIGGLSGFIHVSGGYSNVPPWWDSGQVNYAVRLATHAVQTYAISGFTNGPTTNVLTVIDAGDSNPDAWGTYTAVNGWSNLNAKGFSVDFATKLIVSGTEGSYGPFTNLPATLPAYSVAPGSISVAYGTALYPTPGYYTGRWLPMPTNTWSSSNTVIHSANAGTNTYWGP